MTIAQVVEKSATVNNKSPNQDYVHSDDHTLTPYEMTPGFKPFTARVKILTAFICGKYFRIAEIFTICSKVWIHTLDPRDSK